MPKLTLHFEAAEGTDLESAAAALEANLAEAEGVASVRSRPQRYQSIGLAEIMTVVHIATQDIQTTAALLTSLAALYAAWEKLKPHFPGLKPPTVEVGLDKIPVHQVTPEQAQELAGEA